MGMMGAAEFVVVVVAIGLAIAYLVARLVSRRRSERSGCGCGTSACPVGRQGTRRIIPDKTSGGSRGA